MNLTAEQLHEIFPALSLQKCRAYAPHLSAALEEAKINTPARAAAFLAQLGHESQDLKFLREIWGNTAAQSRYDVRKDLGNTPERDGDGKKFMGRGGLQRTGKKNYMRAQEALALPLLDHPELLELPENAFRSDALYWTDNNLNRLADRLTLCGDARDLANLDKITRAINGGYNGRVDRQRRYLVAISNLPGEIFQPRKGPLPDFSPAVEEPKPKTAEAEAETHPVLLKKLAENEDAKAIGRSAAHKLGNRLGTPLATLLAALEAGDRRAWLGLIIVTAGVAIFIYAERRPIVRVFDQLRRRYL